MSFNNSGNKSLRLRLLFSSTAILACLIGSSVNVAAADVDVIGDAVDGISGGPHGTAWNVLGQLNIGNASEGSLSITNGGQVFSTVGITGLYQDGTTTVSGIGST